MVCTCNAGFYGDGLNCSACKICSSSANTSAQCLGGGSTDTFACRCNAGFYGDGERCSLCKSCALNGTALTLCGGGNVTDVVTCSCNAGFYGDGLNCTACKACDLHAVMMESCSAGGNSDTVKCACLAGYNGTGFACSLCRSGFFSLQGEAHHRVTSLLSTLVTFEQVSACKYEYKTNSVLKKDEDYSCIFVSESPCISLGFNIGTNCANRLKYCIFLTSKFYQIICSF